MFRARSLRLRFDWLEDRRLLSLSVAAEVNLLDGPHTAKSADDGMIMVAANGTFGSATASGVGMNLDAHSMGGDDLSHPASGSASGTWFFRVSGVPSNVQVPIDFVYQTATDVLSSSTNGSSSSLADVLAKYGVTTEGVSEQKQSGSEQIESQNGAIIFTSILGDVSNYHQLSMTVKGNGTGLILASVDTISSGTTGNSTSLGHANFTLTGFSSPLMAQYPDMTLQFDDGTVMKPFLVSVSQLQSIMPGLKTADALRYIGSLNAAMTTYHINTHQREAAFLGQIAAETAQLNVKWWEEHISPTTGPNYIEYTIDSTNPDHVQRAIDEGNTDSGDGLKYHGRGPLQLTWKENYVAASQAIFGDDRLVQNPELVSDPYHPQIGFLTAAWYFDTATTKATGSATPNSLADGLNLSDPAINDVIDNVTYIVNGGGLNGKLDRRRFTKSPLNILKE